MPTPAPVEAPAPVPVTTPWWNTAPELVPAPSAPVDEPPAPAVPPTADPVTRPSATEEEKDPAKAAEALIQRRNRGRAGTVQTSWRGALDVGALVPLRKRLLGE
ncbi:hypothetical protein [Azospirillum brasilense]|uniref:hypothetical protein n=1 Tax=Azospirillum brasilense TaxID=192 RepID=UPI001EDA27B0|nr:hypothetical protein [Azospirillum brasilense]UKJ71853.1 hypothetical protein H1Q64_06860 [Azospirillum brasilense]